MCIYTVFLAALFHLALVITFHWPLVTVTHLLDKELYTYLQFRRSKAVFQLLLPASLLALSTAVAIQNAAHGRENAVQPCTNELRAVAHLFSPLVAGCELLGK